MSDGPGNDTLVVMNVLSARAIAAGATITFTYASADSAIATVDVFRGVTGVGSWKGAGMKTTCSTFDSGPITLARAGLVFRAVGDESGSPAWDSSAATQLGQVALNGDTLATSFAIEPPGTYASHGTCAGSAWITIAASFF
jgi:hypothetical protein